MSPCSVELEARERELCESYLVSYLLYLELLTLILGLTVALVLAEILNVVQVFTPAHAVTVCYCCYCCSAASKQKTAKNRVKPENTWISRVFTIFGYYPHWTLEIVVGHCQAFLIVVQPA